MLRAQSHHAALGQCLARLLALLAHPREDVRAASLRCIRHLFNANAACAAERGADVLTALGGLATDPSPDVRVQVHELINDMTANGLDVIVPQLPQLAAFALHSSADADTRVALAATEFWLSVTSLDEVLDGHPHQAHLRVPVGETLPQLIPRLLAGMRYSCSEIEDHNSERAALESGAEDRPEDIPPVFHRHRDDAPEECLSAQEILVACMIRRFSQERVGSARRLPSASTNPCCSSTPRPHQMTAKTTRMRVTMARPSLPAIQSGSWTEGWWA